MAQILVADHDTEILEVIRTTLDAYHHRTALARSAPIAVHCLNGGGIDCALIGLVNRELEGVRLIKRIRKSARYRHLPVCVMAERPAKMATILNRNHVAANLLLAKPFTTRDLIEAVQILLGDDFLPVPTFGRPKRLSLPSATAAR